MLATPADRRLLVVAERQLWVVSRRQALEAGLSSGQINRRLSAGTLLPMYRGVYRLPGGTPSTEQEAVAGCFACGHGAVTSHAWAAAVHGLLSAPRGPVSVTVPVHRRPQPRGIDVHRSVLLRAHDRSRRGPVPVTSVPRTLLDMAGVLPAELLEDALDGALRANLTAPGRILGYLADPRLATSRGVGVLRALVQDRAGHGVPESKLERLMLRLLIDFGLPRPARQVPYRTVKGVVRVDFVYPEQKVVVEVLGRAPHWGKERWIDDSDRLNALDLEGYDPLQFTWWHVTERRGYVAAMVGTKLGLKPARWVRD